MDLSMSVNIDSSSQIHVLNVVNVALYNGSLHQCREISSPQTA